MRRLAAVIVAAAVVFALGWMWVFGASGETACIDAYPALPEGSSFHEEVTLWPPGVECVYELPNGREETRRRLP